MNVYNGSSFEKTINRTTTHQYLVKKYGHKTNQYFNFEEIIAEIQDAFCMLCESYVPLQQINQHLQQCNGEIDQYEQVDSLQAKLQKCNFLIQKIKKMLKSYSTDQQLLIQYLQMLWKCNQDIILASECNIITQCVDDLDIFQRYFENQPIEVDKITSQILTIINKVIQFAERKLSIIQCNQQDVLNHLKESIATSLANEGFSIEKRNPFSNVQNNFQNMQINNPLQKKNVQQSLRDNLRSRCKPNQTLSPIPETSSIDQSKSQFRPFNQNTIGNLTPRMEESLQVSQIVYNKSEAEKKNLFFKLASQMKQQFPQKQNVQSALIIALYDSAQKGNIPSNQYEYYISNLYQNM